MRFSRIVGGAIALVAFASGLAACSGKGRDVVFGSPSAAPISGLPVDAGQSQAVCMPTVAFKSGVGAVSATAGAGGTEEITISHRRDGATVRAVVSCAPSGTKFWGLVKMPSDGWKVAVSDVAKPAFDITTGSIDVPKPSQLQIVVVIADKGCHDDLESLVKASKVAERIARIPEGCTQVTKQLAIAD